MKHLYLCLWLALCTGAQAQIAINNTGSMPDGSSMLDISSINRGMLIPRMTLAQRNAIAQPATGLLIFQTTSTAGFYFNSGTPAAPVWVYINPADNWGSQVVLTDATLTGNGLAGTPLKLAQQGAGAGQTLKWNGTSWAPENDNAGLTLPFDDTISILDHAFAVTNAQFNAIGGYSLGATGVMAGVRGEANSTSGRGVMGLANSTTGASMGVGGYCMSGGGYGVFALNYGPTGNAIGVKAESLSPTGISVYAINNQGSGQHAVIRSESNSPQGIGVYSVVTATTGANIAVRGSTQSTEGTGVLGRATAASGVNYGVYGTSLSPTGYGVYGKNESSTAGAVSIFGQAIAPQGIGVEGHSGYSDGNTIGVKGSVVSSSGIGVMGESQSATNGIGVVGYSAGTLGTGIMGEGDIGVYGLSGSAARFGVWGSNIATNGNPVGVYGTASINTGTGVLGYSPNIGVKGQSPNIGVVGESISTSSANAFGVYGTSVSPSGGKGVWGSNSATTGTTYGVYGAVSSSSGYAGFFDGRLFANGRTGIRTQNPGAGLHLVGSGFPESFIFLETGAGQDAGFRIYEGATAKWHMFNNSVLAGLQIYNSAGTTAIFMKQSNSYVGIGTTNPTYKLHVDGEAAKTAGTTAWVISSDERLKDIHGQYNKGLSDIETLQPILFNYKAGNSRNLPSNNEYSGLSAQQVQQAFPEAVSTGPDGYLDFNMHSVNIALINAVKELNARIAQLEKELKNLKDAMK